MISFRRQRPATRTPQELLDPSSWGSPADIGELKKARTFLGRHPDSGCRCVSPLEGSCAGKQTRRELGRAGWAADCLNELERILAERAHQLTPEFATELRERAHTYAAQTFGAERARRELETIIRTHNNQPERLTPDALAQSRELDEIRRHLERRIGELAGKASTSIDDARRTPNQR